MTKPVELTDTKLSYVTIAEARKMSGMRLIVGGYAIPAPWRESARSILYVKGISYTPVLTGNEGTPEMQIGMDGSQSDLIEWTAQPSAPVMVWNDERPRTVWIDQLYLAERINPEPRLIPQDIDERMAMFGLCNELAGENGMLWNKRLLMVHGPLTTLPEGDDGRALWRFLGNKYGYSPARAELAVARIVNILNAVDRQLAQQAALGRRYLIGENLSALDIYWACMCGLLDPMPVELCPMADSFRGIYGNDIPDIEVALSAALRAHRDFIYRQHLELPMVF